MLRSVFLVLLAAVAMWATPASAQPRSLVASRIAEILEDEDFDSAYWGALVVDLDTGDRIYESNAYGRFIPASNMKLFTTASALDALGPRFRYSTRLYADGDIQNGTLLGSLVVRGSGDPTFGGRYTAGDMTMAFRGWADSLRAAGVRRIVGPVVGDDDVFDDLGLGKGWAWDDLVYAYAAPVSGLQFNEGTVELAATGTTLGQPARLAVTPDDGYARLVNLTTTGSVPAERVARELASNVYTVSSTVAPGETQTEAVSVVNPTDFFVSTLVAVLRREGIEVDGEAVDVDAWGARPRYDRMQRIATHLSPELSSIVGVTNTDSNNLYAEQILRTMGAYAYTGTQYALGSTEAGVVAGEPFLRRIGIDPEDLSLVDGSGLSAMNRLTPQAIITLLEAMHRHEDPATRIAFYRSLAVGGVTGTLSNRYRGGLARGNVHAKTGYISGARTLSGYVTAANGHTIAFSLMCNNYQTSTARVNRAQDEVVEMLAGWR
ncbi:MAG TPA: D-alanyl-D-alanine carboxypeptidase/D-alanyl-D-alanine-endopeptidase [Rubricoccaceae bacterium]|jgi:D-alanyl-D-alanine carboxypeptidase/D-alanyl-D-alanine-endopeptidase (penicillin-binding protein 4)